MVTLSIHFSDDIDLEATMSCFIHSLAWEADSLLAHVLFSLADASGPPHIQNDFHMS